MSLRRRFEIDTDGDGDYELITPSTPLPVAAMGTTVSKPSPEQLDVFGRVRVSNPVTLFDGNFVVPDAEIKRWTSRVTGSATVTRPASLSVVQLTTAAGASSAEFQSRRRITYQPGKSTLCVISCCPCTTAIGAGTTVRVGYFNEGNGAYFEYTSSGLQAVLRSDTSGSVVNTAAAFNVDALDGTGPSGVALDLTKRQIFFISFKWLGSGNINLGVFVKDEPILAHVFQNTNQAASVPYWNIPSLPIRWEIHNTGADSARTLNAICAAVASEGGYNPRGTLYSYVRSQTASVGTTRTVVLAFRLRSGFDAVSANNLIINTYSDDGDFLYTVIHVRSPTTGTLVTSGTWTDVPNTSLQVNEYGANGLNAYTVTAASSIVVQHFFGAQGSVAIDSSVQVIMSTDIDNISDIFVIEAIKLSTGTKDLYRSMRWQELS